MVVHPVKRLEKGKKPVSIDLHIEAVDFVADHSEETFSETCIAVMRCGVVLWLDMPRKDLVKIMKAAK